MPLGLIELKKQESSYRILEQGKGPIELANQFLRAQEVRGLSLMSVRAYGYALVILYRWLGDAGKTLDSLLQVDLLEFVVWQRDTQATPKTINQRLTVCRIFFRFCHDRDIPRGRGGISLPTPHYTGRGREQVLGLFQRKTPSALKLRVKEPRKIVLPLSSEDVQAFIRRLQRYRDVALVLSMLLCGLRSCEALTLEMGDIDLGERRMRVRGKGNRERVLPMPSELVAAIKKYIKIERPVRTDSERVFLILQGKRRGKPMSLTGVRSLFRHRRLLHGLEHANPHRFRHTFGADMAREGVRLPILQRLMGHASGSTTLQYIHLSMADIASEYQRAMDSIQRRYEEK
jgi:site-specific recombinase XerD